MTTEHVLSELLFYSLSLQDYDVRLCLVVYFKYDDRVLILRGATILFSKGYEGGGAHGSLVATVNAVRVKACFFHHFLVKLNCVGC